MTVETPLYKIPSPTDSDTPNAPAQYKAQADAIDAIKWLSQSVKLTTLEKKATATEVSETFADVAGMTFEITPVAASVLVLAVVPDLTKLTVGNTTFTGIVNVDGESTAASEARGLMQVRLGEAEFNPAHLAVQPRILLIPMTAAKHTVKVQARATRGGGGASAIVGANTHAVGLLLAS